MNYITLSQSFSGAAVGQPGEAVPLSGPSLLVQTTPGCTATVYGSNLPKIEATWQVIGTASGYTGTALTSKFAFIRVSLSAAGSVAISATQNSTSSSTPGSGPVTSDDITDASAIGKQLLQAADAAAARAALDVPTTGALAAKYTKPAGGIPATDLDADPAGRVLLTATSAAERKQVLGLDQVNNTSDANKPISTATQTALDGKMANTLPAMQTAFGAGTALQKAAFQAAVSGDSQVLSLAQMTAPATGGAENGGLRLAADGTTVRWDGDRFAVAVPAPADDAEYGAVWHGRTTFGLGPSGGARAPQSFTTVAEGVRVVSAVRVDATNDYYDLTLPDLYAARNASHTVAVEAWSDDWTAVQEFSYYMANTGYTKFLQARWVAANGAANSGSGLSGSGWRRLWKSSEQFTNSGGFVIGTDQMTQHKFRITQNAGRSSTIIFRAVRLEVPDPRPTISIISDDGYASWHTSALPLLNARGLKAGVAVIADRVGFSGTYVTWAQLQEWAAAGHACHTHGPRNALASLNSYATVPEMVADCVWNRDQILANVPGQADAAAFYVFPQGEYFPSAEGLQSRSLTNALLAAGFKGGRSTILPQTFRADYRRNDAERMIMPTIGHLWSSTNEAANIASIVAQIDNCALRGLSACLVFHQVVTTPTTGIQITAANLTTILDRVAYWCMRGYLRNVLAHEQ